MTNAKRKIAVFDFDGTLTTKDTLMEFIRYCHGSVRLYLGLLLFSPIILLMFFGLYNNGSAKEKLLSWFFKGMSYSEFSQLGMSFAERESEILSRGIHAILQQHLAEGADVYVVTASVEEWVRPFCLTLGVKEVIGTRMEVDGDGRLTGRFSTPNCHGGEKVRRFLMVEPERDSYTLHAYGDSSGDLEMFAFADFSRKV